MRVSEQVLLSSLRQGGCVRSFWRRSASTRQQLPSVLTGQVISIALWQMPGPAGQCGST